MAAIPAEVWSHVAQFMSQDDLCDMIGVNGALFNLAMDARYQSVSFECFDDTAMKRLQRLRDPAVAPRVRRLYVSYNDEDAECSWGERSDIFLYNDPSDDAVQMMTKTISFLSNVVDFSIYWPSDNSCEETIFPLLTTAWETFGSRLRRLVFRAPLGNYTALLSIPGMVAALQELELHISRVSARSSMRNINSVLVTDVAPFVNKVSPTIRKLSLSSDPSSLDFSVFFKALGSIPNLGHLDVRMNISMCGLSEPRGLTRVLRDHVATLRHVKWISWSTERWTDDTFQDWMEENKSDGVILSDLLTLEINIPSNSVSFDLAMGYIKRSADTLTSLLLVGFSLDLDQVNTMVSLFVHRQSGKRLEALHIQVDFLSSELILILAKALPYLEKLNLNILYVTGSLQGWERPITREEELRDARQFGDELKRHDIRSWQLYDIGIVVRSPIRAGMDTLLTLLVAECVPSIRRIFGIEKEELPKGE